MDPVTTLMIELARQGFHAWDIAFKTATPNTFGAKYGSAADTVYGRLRYYDILVSKDHEKITLPGALDLWQEYRDHRHAVHAEERGEEPTRIYDVDVETSSPVEVDYEAQNRELREANTRLFKQMSKLRVRQEGLVQAVYQGAYDATIALGPIKQPLVVPYNQEHGSHSPEVALWHMTDWQGAKKTTSYDSDVMVERVMKFCRKAFIITEIGRQDHPVKKGVLLFGGDMLEGLFNFPNQVFEVDQTIFGQLVTVSDLLVQVALYALRVYDEVEVIAEWGNHGRIGSKRDSVPRPDNFDRIAYEMARQKLRDQTRLTWEDCPEDIQRVEIGAYHALSIHGDEVGRGGIVSDNQMMNHVNRWRAGSYKWDFRDVYIGHYHQHKELPMANGEGAIFFTGSTESDNRYALVGMAASAAPTQRLHFIDPVKGRVTSQHKIYLDD